MCLENQSIPLMWIEGMGIKKVEVLLRCGASRCTIRGQSVIGKGKFWSMSSSPRNCLLHESSRIADGLVCNKYAVNIFFIWKYFMKFFSCFLSISCIVSVYIIWINWRSYWMKCWYFCIHCGVVMLDINFIYYDIVDVVDIAKSRKILIHHCEIINLVYLAKNL